MPKTSYAYPSDAITLSIDGSLTITTTGKGQGAKSLILVPGGSGNAVGAVAPNTGPYYTPVLDGRIAGWLRANYNAAILAYTGSGLIARNQAAVANWGAAAIGDVSGGSQYFALLYYYNGTRYIALYRGAFSRLGSKTLLGSAVAVTMDTEAGSLFRLRCGNNGGNVFLAVDQADDADSDVNTDTSGWTNRIEYIDTSASKITASGLWCIGAYSDSNAARTAQFDIFRGPL